MALVLAQPGVSVAAVVVCLATLRVAVDGFPVNLDGSLRLAQILVGEGTLELAQVVVGATPVDAGQGKLGVEADGLVVFSI